jgi:hypothetical protein
VDVGFRPIIPVPSEGVLVAAIICILQYLIGFSRFTISGFTRTALVTGIHIFSFILGCDSCGCNSFGIILLVE